jgi:hypothetical protein
MSFENIHLGDGSILYKAIKSASAPHPERSKEVIWP